MLGKIASISDEAEGIKVFVVEIGKFSCPAGKYIMISFPDAPDSKHSFSVTSCGQSSFSIAVKKKGDFTTRLFSVSPGQELLVFGPYGRFVLPKEEQPLIFIAGGIGITPLYSMLHAVHNSGYGQKIYLFYSAKTRREMAFLDELERVDDNRISVHLFFTSEGGKFIDAKLIQDSVPEFDACLFYICGPPPMMDSLRKQLAEIGVSEERIRSEEFQ